MPHRASASTSAFLRPSLTPRGGRDALRRAIAAALATPALMLAVTPASADTALEEIVVTARKRAENLQDVPISIGVFSDRDIQNLGISQFEDFATRSPSISFISIGPGTQSFFIRGVSDGSNPNYPNSSTTGYFIDDMSMSYYGGIPDLHAYDIDRIEVLNGPQGTLFGAGSMSGAVRIITKKPDKNSLAAGIDLGVGKIDAGGTNSSYEGFLNVPLVAGQTALRLSVYDVHQGGFINNLLRTRHWVNGTTSTNAEWARDNYNTQHVQGARVALAQSFPAGWEATLTGTYQGQNHNGAWDEDRQRYGDRNVARFGPEYGDNWIRMLNLHVNGDVGVADLVYAGGYFNLPYHRVSEYSEYTQYANAVGVTPLWIESYTCQQSPQSASDTTTPFVGCHVPVMYTDQRGYTERTSHELRLESKPGSWAHWVVGAFTQKTYTYGGTRWIYPGVQFSGVPAQNQISYYGNVAQPLPFEWYTTLGSNNRRETTEFGDLTYDLTPKLGVEVGIEHFKSSEEGISNIGGYFWNAKTPSTSAYDASKNNFKAGLQYKATDTALLYFSFGQGFRDGGLNQPPATCTRVPQVFKPDTLNNFEVGWKTSAEGGRLVWDGAVYYMDWQDYQTRVYDLSTCPVQFNANLGKARVRGVESNVSYQVLDGLTVAASGSYNDSHLLSNEFQSATWVVAPGERLPNVPIIAYSASVRYERTLADSLRGYAQFDDAHKGQRWSDLRLESNFGLGRASEPAYDVANLRFGVDNVEQHWGVEAYITNLTNTRAVVFVNTANYDHRDTTNEPRVYGLRVKYRVGRTP